MIQRCSVLDVLEVFFKEPTKMHFIREISRDINLATTSVRKHIDSLIKDGLVLKKNGRPFEGLIANRESEKFIFYKRVYNLYSLYGLREKIVSEIGPKALVLFGSYQRGEDIESSDIDLVIISKVKKELNFEKVESFLKRKIHVTFLKNLEELDKNMQTNIKNGWIIYGSI